MPTFGARIRLVRYHKKLMNEVFSFMNYLLKYTSRIVRFFILILELIIDLIMELW